MKIFSLVFIWLALFQSAFSQVLDEIIIRPNSLSAFDMFGSRFISDSDYLYVSAASSSEPDPYKTRF